MKGFVFGKFLPFHKGHEAMIRFGAENCDHLTVVVCCSDKENTSSSTRSKWLKETFSVEENIEILALEYIESELPNTSVASEEISEIWARKFSEILPAVDLLFTSEPYGEMVARFMKIKHLSFDEKRLQFPVSATAIRTNLKENWKFTAEKTRKDLGILVVILGTESVGKTTLVNQLGYYFKCSIVEEAGRDLITDSNDFTFDDLYKVAEEHALRIEKAFTGNSPLVIADTNCLITESYAHFSFDKNLHLTEEIRSLNSADLYLYLCNDVPYIQDGTRLSEAERNQLDLSHRQVLKKQNIPFIEISGNWVERLKQAKCEINNLRAKSNA